MIWIAFIWLEMPWIACQTEACRRTLQATPANKLVEHKQYIREYGNDMPEIRELEVAVLAANRTGKNKLDDVDNP